MVAFASIVLFGFLGLALDVNYIYHYRRLMQTAADAGALGGGAEIYRGQTSTVIAASARMATAINHFTDGTDGIVVTVHHPPQTGYYIGNVKYVEVLIERPLPIFVMRMFGFTDIRVPARAVAGVGASAQACIYALDTSMEAAFYADSSVEMNASCGIVVNSNHPNAMNLDSNADINASDIAITGGYTTESNATVSPTPTTGVPAQADPLGSLPVPTYGPGCDYTNFRLVNDQTATLNPGVYCGGIWLEGNSVATLNGGMYILIGGQDSSYEKGSLHLAGNAIVRGTGVTFYLTQSATPMPAWGGSQGQYRPFAMESSTQAELRAPTTGDYAGILFFEDRSIGAWRPDGAPGEKPWTHQVQSSTTSILEGALYFPNQLLQFTSSTVSTSASYSIIIARAIALKSSADWNVGNNYSGLPQGSPIKRLSLVE